MTERRTRYPSIEASRPATDAPRITMTELMALAASGLWILVAGGAMIFGGTEGSGIGALAYLLVLVLPVAMIWIAAITLRSARVMRDEAQLLTAAVDQMRQALHNERQGRGAKPMALALSVPETDARDTDAPMMAEPLDIEVEDPRGAPLQPAPPLRSGPPPAAVIRPLEEQPSLAFESRAEDEAQSLSIDDLVRALNFPESDQDTEGFIALRAALRDRQLRKLIQAAQDVLTLLSQDGIYMDDLRPDRARPEIWRRFAMGERGRSVAQLGGIHDRSCLALTMARMREDTIFRDTAHHFLRLFDRMLSAYEPSASDGEIAALSETRTARAFMLFGRVTGAFD